VDILFSNPHDDTESVDINIQCTEYETYPKVFCVAAEVRVFNFCFTVLHSLGWNRFVTLSIIAFLKDYCCVYSTIWFLWYSVCWTVKSDGDCQLIPSVHKVNSLSFLLCLLTGNVLS